MATITEPAATANRPGLIRPFAWLWVLIVVGAYLLVLRTLLNTANPNLSRR